MSVHEEPSADHSPAIDARGLSKRFMLRSRKAGPLAALRSLFRAETSFVDAVRDVDLLVQRGERIAFVGPNGAGKSTTIKMLKGILHSSAGQARVLGHVPWKERKELGRRIGTVFGQRSQLWPNLPASDSYDLLAHVYDLDRKAYSARRDMLESRFQIGELVKRPVRVLSLGERMRCEIVASLLHAPEMLFLDEPTIGLDVTAKAVIRDMIKQSSEEDGATVLLTSHDTGDMERVCERCVVIADGALLLDRPVSELRSAFISRKLITLMMKDASISLDLPGVEVIEQEPYRIKLEVETAQTPVEAVVDAAMKATRLRDLTVEDPPMEEIVGLIYDMKQAPDAATESPTSASGQGEQA